MRALEIDVVLDVGANAGFYAERLRRAGYCGRMVSLEPLSEAFGELQRRCAGDPRWTARRLALGDADGEAEIHVAANSWSSSLLDMGERHLRSAPESAYVTAEPVPVARLDSVWSDLVRDGERVFLKLDVQGFELHVIQGAPDSLGRVEGLQTELSLVSLYEGDAGWRDVLDLLHGHGFELAGLDAGFEDPETGRMLQFDATLVRGGREV